MEHEHNWEVINETDYGEMDYSSYGGGVEPFVVTLYRCSACGAIKKECRGDFSGDPSEYLEITDGERKLAERDEKCSGVDERAEFYRDVYVHSMQTEHVISGNIPPKIKEIDELYGYADALSIQNGEKHRRVLLLLSVVGTLLTLAFLLYDEVELHGLILACGVMIICLAGIHRISNRLDCHRKYLQYRVLAESLRVQFFLLIAGIRKHVTEIMPWSIKKSIPWVVEVLEEIPLAEPGEKTSVLDCWVRDQKKYHEAALKRAELKNQRDGHISKAALIVTILVYIAALFFELVVYPWSVNIAEADSIRVVLKVLLGIMSAVTLFTGSYYGKMSLSNSIEDHKRMIALYETTEEKITEEGETEELILFLAREFLNENSTRYAYQSQNKPDIVI